MHRVPKEFVACVGVDPLFFFYGVVDPLLNNSLQPPSPKKKKNRNLNCENIKKKKKERKKRLKCLLILYFFPWDGKGNSEDSGRLSSRLFDHDAWQSTSED